MKIYFVILLFLSHNLLSQDFSGAESQSMGTNVAVMEGIWSMNGNHAGLRSVQHAGFGFTYERLNLQTAIVSQAMVAVLPYKALRLGFSIANKGIEQYRLQQLSLGVSKSFGPSLSIGMAINRHQLKITNYGKDAFWSVDAGFMYDVSKQFSIGAYAQNLGNSTFSTSQASAEHPFALELGIAFQPTHQIRMLASINQTLAQVLLPKLGLSYQPHSAFAFRGGLALNTLHQFVGMGFWVKKLHIDWSVVNRAGFGYSTQVSTSYEF